MSVFVMDFHLSFVFLLLFCFVVFVCFCRKLYSFHLVHSLGEGSKVLKSCTVAAGRGSGSIPGTRGSQRAPPLNPQGCWPPEAPGSAAGEPLEEVLAQPPCPPRGGARQSAPGVRGWPIFWMRFPLEELRVLGVGVCRAWGWWPRRQGRLLLRALAASGVQDPPPALLGVLLYVLVEAMLVPLLSPPAGTVVLRGHNRS